MRTPFLNITIVAVLLLLCCCSSIPAYHYSRQGNAIPLGEDWREIIPAAVGEFSRIKMDEPSDNRDGKAFYKHEKQMLVVRFMKLEDERKLKLYMVEASKDIARPREWNQRKVHTSGENKYVVYKQPGNNYVAWNRGLYYFDVLTDNEAVLDEFLKNFPY
ncbi:hypothetical protein [Aridibaculum aurantiacum]|uniref:hypothetical protein n=1 Tax=Aridibaculum aurantiacum TaxID=2810307 RepID=UPI001A9685DC|nr:hypothetical protein [Aridibaculum aurantiacum]